MGVLSDLEPKNVFYYFEEITKIPHGSGNVEQISDYLASFAKERNLFYIQDAWKNIIIVKEASAGYEKEPAVILQGHMDMVAVKTPDCDIDMKTEGLRLAVEGDEIYAKGTSLGGDDGIAVAYCLALLDSQTLKHPKLEVILTVDEEVGLDGAKAIDLSMLTGKRMVNLDSEEEGVFLTSCAGGARVKCSLSLSGYKREAEAFRITLGGLRGGHSGEEIHRERGNANCLFGRLLKRLTDRMDVCLCEAAGGLADNAIPQEVSAVIAIDPKDRSVLEEMLSDLEQEIKGELAVRDPGFCIRWESLGQGTYDCACPEDTKKAANFLTAMPNGVQAMSADIEGLVETSLNLGILEYKGDGLAAEFSVRSSVESEKYALIDKLRAVAELAGGSIEVTGDYPGWAYRQNSPLRDKMVALYEKLYGAKPEVEAIHAGSLAERSKIWTVSPSALR